jgi:hypothetical protein
MVVLHLTNGSGLEIRLIGEIIICFYKQAKKHGADIRQKTQLI